jgi:patatin-like phospholipase/acyl hydrolase
MSDTTAGGNSGAGRLLERAQPSVPQRDAKRVLCLDGGGIRGMLPAMLVAEIERRCDAPASVLFDLIAGTSTGGIIAMGLAMPGENGKPAFSAADGVAIYRDKGPSIFAKGGMDVLHSLGGLAGERYPADGLEEILHHTFGELRLTDALTEVLVCAYEISRRETYVFSSHRARTDPGQDVFMWQAVRSTTAAPTFFEPSRIVDPAGRIHVLIDGAVYANSPAMCAFAEIQQNHHGSDLVIASVGAGSLTHRFEYEEARDWGVGRWARPLFEIVLDGSAQTSDHVLGQLLGRERYFRFQQELIEATDSLDDVTPSNLAALEREGNRMIAQSAERLDKLCELLSE